MEPKYISTQEAAKRLHVTQATLYYYIKRLGLETKKFHLDKRAYLLESDVERIEALKAQASARREGEEHAA
jgi:DNA-binding transcriptional MerR regulator